MQGGSLAIRRYEPIFEISNFIHSVFFIRTRVLYCILEVTEWQNLAFEFLMYCILNSLDELSIAEFVCASLTVYNIEYKDFGKFLAIFTPDSRKPIARYAYDTVISMISI